jgi:hypothetical protein
VTIEEAIINTDSEVEPTESARVGDKLPKALGPGEMAKAFGISYSTFNRQEKAGEFKPLLLPRRIGRKKYSGEKVQTFLNGRK